MPTCLYSCYSVRIRVSWSLLWLLLQFLAIRPARVRNRTTYPSYRLPAQLRTALHLPIAARAPLSSAAVGAVTKASGQTELEHIEQSQEEALILSTLSAGNQVQHYPNLQAIAQKLSGRNSVVVQQMVDYGKACIAPGLQYVHDKFSGEPSESVAAF